MDLTTDQPVPVILLRPAALQLDPEATYILSGGLGGLGPSIAEMMIEHGAHHLVFLSRSGPKSAEAQEHIRRLSDLGCRAEAFACDTGSLASVESVQQQLRTEQGCKIRGVVQCAMVLRDSTFENMTHQKWTESIQPKIYGSWNLHKVFGSQPLDFFMVRSPSTSPSRHISTSSCPTGCRSRTEPRWPWVSRRWPRECTSSYSCHCPSHHRHCPCSPGQPRSPF